jgi:hypothetical protein
MSRVYHLRTSAIRYYEQIDSPARAKEWPTPLRQQCAFPFAVVQRA